MNWELWNGDTWPIWLVFLVNIGAVYRICRLIAKDSITDKIRGKITTKFSGALVTLLVCMWCLGFWFSIAAVLLTSWDTTNDVWLVIASILTISTAVGYLAERE